VVLVNDNPNLATLVRQTGGKTAALLFHLDRLWV